MTNEELKKKIAQIIADYFCPQGNEHKKLWGDDRLCYSKMNFAECEWVTECTDALIVAGVGYIREAEHRAARAERALRSCVEYYRFTHMCPIPDCESADKCWNERCVSDIAEYFEEQAEKELAEEEKDD